MEFRPKQLANKYGLSANTLRNYEAKGIIPPADRSANGYRMYTERHEAYLVCIQAMIAGFGMDVTSAVMHNLERNELDNALWIVREREVMLHQNKTSLDQLVKAFRSYSESGQGFDCSQQFSIHEVSRRTGAPKSAIRYWEKSGLFTTERDPDNKYRLYHEAHLFKIKLIQVLQCSVYSEDTVNLKRSIAHLKLENIEHAIKISEHIHAYLHKTIKLQMRALYDLYRLMQTLGYSEPADLPT